MKAVTHIILFFKGDLNLFESCSRYVCLFAYTNSITHESVTVAHFCSMNICGMVSFGGLLSEKLPCLMFGLTFVHCIKVIVPNLSCAKNLIIWECCSCKTFDKFRVSQFVWHFIEINTLSCPRLRERTLMMEENTRPLKVISVSASGPSLCTLSETKAK